MRDHDLTRLLNLKGMVLEGVLKETPSDVYLAVGTALGTPVCRKCGHGCLLVHSTRVRTVRHLDAFGRRTWLVFESRLIDCMSCGLGVEAFGFVDPGKRTSAAFRRWVGGLCAILPIKTVSEHVHVAEDTVRTIDKAYLKAEYPASDLSALRTIAIDEIAYHKGHKYLTIVLNYDTGEVIWTGEGRREATLATFFEAIGPALSAQIEFVSMDMAAPFINAVKAACPKASIVFDRFHVAKHMNEAVNDTRKLTMAKADQDIRKGVKGKRFVLLKRGKSLTPEDQARLEELLTLNTDLTKAYLMKEDLQQFWTCPSEAAAAVFLDTWITEAQGSGIAPVAKVGRMLGRHRDGLLAYHRKKISNGPLEGLNLKINVLRRSRYGFRDLEYFGLKIRQLSILRSRRRHQKYPILEDEKEAA